MLRLIILANGPLPLNHHTRSTATTSPPTMDGLRPHAANQHRGNGIYLPPQTRDGENHRSGDDVSMLSNEGGSDENSSTLPSVVHTDGASMATDDRSIVSGVSAPPLVGFVDFASKIGDLDALGVTDEGKMAIRGLLRQIEQMKARMRHDSARVDILSKQYSTKAGYGKNCIKKTKDMLPIDENNVSAINSVVSEYVAPNEMILKYGWDIYSNHPDSFCQRFLKKANVQKPDVYNTVDAHWMGFVAPWINYAMSRKRNNLTQAMRRHFNSKSFVFVFIKL